MSEKKPAPKSIKNPKPTAVKTRGLGRGLSALMADVAIDNVAPDAQTAQAQKPEPATRRKDITRIATTHLVRNPDQPRRYFDPKKLDELTQSIRDKGVLQPILVRPLPRKAHQDAARYQIVAGERRWQAALKAGLDVMPVLVRDLSDQDVLEIGVVENVQRADLNPVEEALAYKALIEQFNRTQEDVAKAIGKSRPHITNMLRLLTLPERAQDFLKEGKITMGHARAIIAAPDPNALVEDIVSKTLSVREAEDWVRRIKRAGETIAPVKRIKSADIRAVENQLIVALGLDVDLRHTSPGGELRIKYKTGEQLDDVIRRLKSNT